MPNLLAKLRAMSVTGTASKSSWSTYRDGPGNSADLSRIAALPRRPLPSGEEAKELAAQWTYTLKRDAGTMALRPIQAIALDEAIRANGLLGLIGVGWGKTLLSLLLPTVWESRVTVLLIPPNLKTKLFELEYPYLARHWHIPNLVGHPLQFPDQKGVLHVVSYSDLSSAKRADILERIKPDVVVCDEAHSLRYATAARTKRFKRYFRVARRDTGRNDLGALPVQGSVGSDVGQTSGGLLRVGPGRPYLALLSGTLTARGIADYAHLSNLALGNGSPMPLDWNVLQEWGFALDPGDLPAPSGELWRLDGDTGDTTNRRRHLQPDEVRAAFRRRLVETPGVVATVDNDPGMGLVFSKAPLTAPKSVLDQLDKVRADWVRPDGEVLRQALDVYAVTRQLACGFYYRRIFPHGEAKALITEWVLARREYFSEVRKELQKGRPALDSPLLLWNAAKEGKWKSEFWANWASIRERVKPEKETVWVDRFLVEAAVEWAKEKPGIVWVESDAVKAAFVIAKEAGIPVYTGGAEDEAALIRETGKRSVVCGIRAFNAGVNLQMFNRALITTCPASAALLEQVIGREHRPGQEADEVSVDFYLHTPEMTEALKAAREKAKYIEETTGNRQKLNVGTWLF